MAGHVQKARDKRTKKVIPGACDVDVEVGRDGEGRRHRRQKRLYGTRAQARLESLLRGRAERAVFPKLSPVVGPPPGHPRMFGCNHSATQMRAARWGSSGLPGTAGSRFPWKSITSWGSL